MNDDDLVFMQFLANDNILYDNEIFELAAVATYNDSKNLPNV